MTSPCVILRSSAEPPPYPLPEGWTGEPAIWTGSCRLQPLKREAAPVPGEQPTQLRDYLAVLPVEVLNIVRVGERGDVLLVRGRRYQIQQAMHGSQLWEADLICQDNQTQQNP